MEGSFRAPSTNSSRDSLPGDRETDDGQRERDRDRETDGQRERDGELLKSVDLSLFKGASSIK